MPEPTVTVGLTPDGGLKLGLEGPHGGLRWVSLRHAFACETITKVLEGMVVGQSAFGEQGAPSAHQVEHWSKHQIFKDDRCPFCKDELAEQEGVRRLRRSGPPVRHQGEVQVRTVPAKGKGSKAPKPAKVSAPLGTSRKSLEEIGL